MGWSCKSFAVGLQTGRLALLLLGPSPSLRLDLGWRQSRMASRLFDSTFGFPGEGPFGFWFFLLLTLFSKFRVFGAVAASSASHGPLRPRNAADLKRSRARAAFVLQTGRPVEDVEAVTQRRRAKFLEAFEAWLGLQEVSLVTLLSGTVQATRSLNRWLVAYGRQLFEGGWPCSHYSEVINAITAKEPSVPRSLQPSRDLAFTWLREEPHTHHISMPW